MGGGSDGYVRKGVGGRPASQSLCGVCAARRPTRVSSGVVLAATVGYVAAGMPSLAVPRFAAPDDEAVDAAALACLLAEEGEGEGE